MMLGAATLTIILGWFYLYLRAHGRSMRIPAWIEGLRRRLYILFVHQLYVDQTSDRLGRSAMQALHRFDKGPQGWLP